MKSREIAHIRTVERIIENTRVGLERPEVQDALGEFAVRTIALVEKLYVPPVIGGKVLVSPARRDTDWIPIVISRSGRKLTYPIEVTPTQVQRVETEKMQHWRNVSDRTLTSAEIAKLDEYDYAASVKWQPIRRANLGAGSRGITLAVTQFTSVIGDCSVAGESGTRTVEVRGKPLVTIDPGYATLQTSSMRAAIVHELQHVDDVLERPLAVYDTMDAADHEDDDFLRTELRAYGVQAAYLRAINVWDRQVEVIEFARMLHNGQLLDNPDAFQPSQSLKNALADAGLSDIYR